MINKKLRNLRKAKGMSQGEIAKILCTDTSNYSRKERGEIRMQEYEWEKIAKALDVTVEDIKEQKQYFNKKNETSTSPTLSENGHTNINLTESLVKNLQDFIKHLQSENKELKEKLKKFEQNQMLN